MIRSLLLILLSFSTFNSVIAKNTGQLAENQKNIVKLDIATLPDNKHLYFVEILEKAIRWSGYSPQINLIPNLDYQQITKMMDANRLSLRWLIPTAERNEKYVPIEVDIFDGMIGKRVLYIPKNTQAQYSKITTLEEFRNTKLTAGFGKDWYDVDVWRHNKLPLVEVDREWRRIYAMIASKQHPIDYITRSVVEVGSEYPDLKDQLDVEQHLLFYYERPYYFYLTKRRASYHNIIKRGLEHLKSSGEMTKIIDKFWGDSLDYLNLENRQIIKLESPGQL